MDEDLNTVTIGGAPCTVISSTIEMIICKTSPESWSNSTETTSPYSWESKTMPTLSSPDTVAEPTSVTASYYGTGFTVSGSPTTVPTTHDHPSPPTPSSSYAIFTLTDLLNFPSGYNITLNTPSLPTSCIPPAYIPIVINHGASTTVVRPPFASSIPLGTFLHSPGATFTVTLDASETPTDSCLPVGTIDVTHHPTHSLNFGCTDPKAANYDPSALYEDESCTYMKGENRQKVTPERSTSERSIPERSTHPGF